MIRRNYILLTLFLLVAGLCIFQYSRRTCEYRSDQFLMDTLVSIKAYGTNAGTVKNAVDAAYVEMHRIAELADGFPKPGTAAWNSSDVCRINEQAGIKPVTVHKDVIAMVTLARKYFELSNGAFDVTIDPVMDQWGFGGENPHIPPPGALGTALALVDSRNLLIDEQARTVFLRTKGMKLDLGAVAKGYATEKAAEVLTRHGITKALIDAGGNIRVLGRNVRDTPWKIGIKDPRKSEAIIAVVSMENAAAVTSGDYYRHFESGGKRYHHILDPRTGYPANQNMSATVVTRDAGLADVLSTVFFVLSPEKALEMAGRIPGVELFLVTADGQIRHSPALNSRLEIKEGSAYHYDPSR